MGTNRWLRVSCANALFLLGLTIAANPAFGAVGRTAGSFNVTQAGTAEYTVPLWTPPGAGGMRPELALSYSHARGNGILGMGFQIGGLSVIHRCPKTIAQDGADGAITLTSSDVFCLDGSRLRLETGTPYGAPGTTYRTERETFARVTANGVGPGWFEVRHKNGLIYEYGNSVDSRIDFGSAAARSWALTSIRDRGGNRITFTYIEDVANGSFRPNAINYATNPDALVTIAPYQVLFVYETANRPDPIYGNYPAGGPENEFKRLEKIEIRYNGSPVKIYRFAYEAIGGSVTRSRLSNFQECSTSVNDCLAAANLSWSSGVAAFQAEQNPSQTAATSVHLIDVDGDGRDDMVYTSHVTSGSGTWRIRKANASGGFDSEINTGISNAGYASARPLEWDGDGRMDLLVPYAGGKWHVLRSTGSGFDNPVDTTISATGNYDTLDINGDGIDELVRMSASGEAKVFVRYRQGNIFGAENLLWAAGSPNVQFIMGFAPPEYRYRSGTRRADFDGDGKEDFIAFLSEYDPESGQTGYFTARMYAGVPAIFDSGPDLGGIHLYGDFNGDGLTDILWMTYYGFRLIHGGSTTIIAGPAKTNLNASTHVLMDFDGDGRDDMLIQHTGTLQLQLFKSTGINFAAGVPTAYSYPSFAAFRAGDVNGDGFRDLLSWHSSQVKYRLHEPYFPDLLLEAKDGFDVKAAFTYAPMTDATVYTKGTGAGFPQYDYQAGIPLVKQVTATDGSGQNSTYTLSFTYKTARRDRWGRGFLGFAERAMVDSRLGHNLRTEETYLQTWPYTGLVSSATLKQSSGTEISKTTNAWAALTYSSGNSIRHFPRLTSSTTERRELNGTLIVTEVTTVTSIDSISGLITDATTTTTEIATGLNGGSSKSERIYHSAVFNDTSNWCIGRPDYSQVEKWHTLSSGALKSRRVDPTWDGPKCRVTQQVIEPNDPDWAVTTALGYDAFGNVSSQSVTGAGMSARTTTIDWGATGQFPETITNALSQQTQQGFRYDLGLRTSVTDPNDLVTSFEYDVFGRLALETRSDGTKTTWTIAADSSDAPRSRYRVDEIWRKTDHDPIQQTQIYFDRFDRAYQQLEQVPASGGHSWSSTKVDFDARGRVTRRYNPWFAGGPVEGYWSFTYDSIDRVTAEQLYSAAGALDRQWTHAFNGLSVTTTDPKSYQTTRYATAWGDHARVTDAESGNTDYQYEAFGLPAQVHDASGNLVTSIGYNVRGMKTSSIDMDLGSWTFLPNALGELERIRDAKAAPTAWTTIIGYDPLGRMTTREDVPEGSTAHFTFGTVATYSPTNRNIGRLIAMSGPGPGYSENLSYDDKGRLKTRSITTDTTYQIDVDYDPQTGLQSTLTYPTSTSGHRFKLQYEYAFGALTKIKRFDSPGTEYWKLNSLDARGNALDEDLGNGLKVLSGFDPLTGLIEYRQSGPGGSGSIQNLSYGWDLNGNLDERQDLRQGLTESFTYDGLNRLRTVTLGANVTNIHYDLIGNITRKTDVSPNTWTYHGSKKHAVTATGGGPTYGYDANGNVSSKSGASISWTSFNMPSAINGSGVSSQFWYGPDRQRFRQVANFSGGSSETTHYVGGVLEKVVTGSNIHYRHFIAGPTGLVAIYTRRVTADPTLEDTFYFTHDHLGSVDSITKADGSVQVRLSYDAFGRRRQEAGWSGPILSPDWTGIGNATRRGYTEHEHLDNLGLIHMNGRVQDPLIGRFLSPDPFVPDPFDGQSFNRYSYVRNNPLTRIDPTGFDDTCTRFCISISFGPGPGGGLAPDLRGTGVMTPSYGTAAGLTEYGQTADLLVSVAEVDHHNRVVAQGEQATLEFADLIRKNTSDANDVSRIDPDESERELIASAVILAPRIPVAVEPVLRPTPITPPRSPTSVQEGVRNVLRDAKEANRPPTVQEQIRNIENAYKHTRPETRQSDPVQKPPTAPADSPLGRGNKLLEWLREILDPLGLGSILLPDPTPKPTSICEENPDWCA